MNLHVQRIGKQVITEVEEVKPPPPVQGKIDAGGASATAMLVTARNWRCGGALFDDEQGRRWRLVNGLPQKDQPGQLSGWRLVATAGEPRFFTTDGRLFMREERLGPSAAAR